MKSLIALLHMVLAEASTRSGVSTARDSQTITSRVEHEGISFFNDFPGTLRQGFHKIP